jgi:hypothetical protein
MVRFNKAKAAAAAPVVRGGQVAREVALKTLVSTEPPPLGGVSTVGRIGFIFGFTLGHLQKM